MSVFFLVSVVFMKACLTIDREKKMTHKTKRGKKIKREEEEKKRTDLKQFSVPSQLFLILILQVLPVP